MGPIHLLNQTAPHRPDDPILLVRVPHQEVTAPSNTVVVRWDTLGDCPVTALTSAGNELTNSQAVAGSALFPEAIAGTALRAMTGPAAASALVPLCYLAEHSGGYHVYAQIRFYAEDACFVRTTPEPVGNGPVESLR